MEMEWQLQRLTDVPQSVPVRIAEVLDPGRDPVRRGLQDLDRLSTGEPGGRARDPGEDPFARQGVAHEHHPAPGLPGHAPAAVCDVAHGQFHQARPAGFRPKVKRRVKAR